MYEEIGISVKTLNRTIARLKEEGLFAIQKGKITMSPKQLKCAKERIGYYRQMNVKQ
ncbi:MAG: hypothetical protein U0O17_07820 [Longicatena caecimuris]|uniref:hypothetical protein n=1 Tax=Longicatena TaxID=1918536 RepID=UPI000315C5DE|nr:MULTISPECIES: hypothetical protein [Longicatena]MCB5393837.1 hypothetical protein [Longicatena caecimuris]MCB5564792.1 hypothetical protein [Longicatena caecimuris]MCB6265124.1 hypothetical protein [Longicatena sp. 210702-DFI.1.160]MCB6315696.1 hypothetical protein [Longicatena sp. 210702-DFI.1.100]MCB6429603.1 hypothetical protein [Longicatena sp. 210702-DFI.1.36]